MTLAIEHVERIERLKARLAEEQRLLATMLIDETDDQFGPWEPTSDDDSPPTAVECAAMLLDGEPLHRVERALS